MPRIQIEGLNSLYEEPKISTSIKENPYAGVIYRFTNKVNNKVYIGSSSNIERRYRDHINGTKSCSKRLFRAIQKYGKENFTFEILETCNIENLYEREQVYLDFYYFDNIKIFQSLTYNLNPTAKGSKGLKWTEEQKIKRKLMGLDNPMLGKKHSDETKRKIALKTKERLKDPTKNPMYGKNQSKESIEKSLKKMEQTLLKSFYYIDIDGIIKGPFKNVRKFADENKHEKSGILKCLSGRIPHYKKLKFYYENSN